VSQPTRASMPLVIVALIALPLLLAGCGGSSNAAPTAATATAIPPTTPPQPTSPPVPRATAGPPATATPPPTPTPIPLDAHARAIAIPGLVEGTLPTLYASARTRTVADLTNGVLRVVSLDQGMASSPITLTQDSQGAQVALDLARGRAVAVSAATVGVSPTLWLADLAGTRAPISRTIAGPAAPQRYIGGIAVDPATGDALVAATGESLMGIAAQLLRVAPSGTVRRSHQIGDTPTALYLDTAHNVAVVATSASSASSGATTLTFAGYDARTLAPLWTAPAPYDPATTRFDPARGQLWLMATGGRATILSTRTGRAVATIDPSYMKAPYWTQNKDLVLDGARSFGYISWGSGTTTGGQQVGIDRIDLRAGRRTTLTTDGGTLLAVAARSGRLVTLDAGGADRGAPTDGRARAGDARRRQDAHRPGPDDGERGRCGGGCGRSGRGAGGARVAGGGALPGPGERGDDNGRTRHRHVPRSSLSKERPEARRQLPSAPLAALRRP